MKSCFKSPLMVAAMFFVSAATVSAQGLLKKAKNAVKSVTSTTEQTTADTQQEGDTTSIKLAPADFPDYGVKAITVTAGNPDGTDNVTYRLYDKRTGDLVSEEVAEAQNKLLNDNVNALIKKVGAGAATGAAVGVVAGAKKGGLKGAAIGGGAGLVAGGLVGALLSKDNIKVIKEIRPQIKKREELIAAYRKSYDTEGKPTNAELSKEEKEALGEINEEVMSATDYSNALANINNVPACPLNDLTPDQIESL